MDNKKYPLDGWQVAAPLVAIISFTCYSGTFHFPFQFDDETMFVNSDPSGFLKDARTIWSVNPSRFVHFLSFGINYWIGGTDTFGYHVVNFAIHLANVFLVWRLMEMIVGMECHRSCGPFAIGSIMRRAPLFAALLFAAHPLQTQAVTYIWQRSTSLSAFFYLLSLLLYLKFARSEILGAPRRRLLAVSLLSAIAAMFTKQIAVTLPVAVAIVDYYFVSRSLSGLRRRMTVIAAYLPVLLVVPAMSAMGYSRELTDVSDRALRVAAHSEYLFTQFNVIVTYIRLLAWPVGQNLDYDYPLARSLADCLPSLVLLCAIFALGVWLFRRNRIASFGIIFFFLAISVESSIFPLEDLIFEHRAYLPSVGAFAAFWALTMPVIGKITYSDRGQRIIAVAFITVILIPLIAATRARNEVWKDKITLWSDVAEKSPGKPRGYIHIGLAHMRADRLGDAETWFNKAAQVAPQNAYAHYMLGKIYVKRGEDGRAIGEFEAALSRQDNLSLAHMQIGDIHMRRGDCPLAAKSYIRAVNLAPGMVEFRMKLGRALEKCGDRRGSATVFESVLKIEPENIEARQALDAQKGGNSGR
ncbi:MAG: tetratricopeptide repeat protein [Nitrospinae bacterium]|nr:tetratricopeptide repeat protein [Nitrospinota bacterium]